MTPVDQLILDDARGDCLRCCVASILELPADEVPNFVVVGGAFWARDLSRWLDGRGWTMLEMFVADGEAARKIFFGRPAHYLILTGPSPRHDADGVRENHHAVVARTKGWGVEIVHDPHPSRAGLAPRGNRYLRFIFPKP